MIDKHSDGVYAPRAPAAAPEPGQVMVNLQDLGILAATAQRNGTTDRFVEVALQWAEKANAEIQRLRAEVAAHRPQKPLPEYRILHLLDLAMARSSGPPRSAGDVVVAVVRAIEALPTQD